MPDVLKDLADIQPLKVDLNEWDKDIQFIVGTLRTKFGFELKRSRYTLPMPDPLIAKTVPLTWSALENEVAQALPEWRIEFSDDPEKLHYKRVELVRHFEFRSFPQAIEFINAASKYAIEYGHHPRWMNLWRTVTVWLSTWDAGHRIICSVFGSQI